MKANDEGSVITETGVAVRCRYIYPTRNVAEKKSAGERCNRSLKTPGATRCSKHNLCGEAHRRRAQAFDYTTRAVR